MICSLVSVCADYMKEQWFYGLQAATRPCGGAAATALLYNAFCAHLRECFLVVDQIENGIADRTAEGIASEGAAVGAEDEDRRGFRRGYHRADRKSTAQALR